MGEFTHLTSVAQNWSERGGEIYYMLFENERREPPGPVDLERWEANGERDGGGALPFRVLKDHGIYAGFPGFGSLPYIIVLDGQMVIQHMGAAPGIGPTTAWMEELMGR